MHRYFDVRTTVLLVVGYGILPEEEDRPVAYQLKDSINSRTGGVENRSAVVVTDMWMLNQDMADMFPAIAIGGPAASRTPSYVIPRRQGPIDFELSLVKALRPRSRTPQTFKRFALGSRTSRISHGHPNARAPVDIACRPRGPPAGPRDEPSDAHCVSRVRRVHP